MIPKCKILCLFSIFIFFVSVGVVSSENVETKKMLVGKSQLIDSSVSIKRVSVGNPDVVDVVIISRKQVLLNAKVPGVTNVILWKSDGKCQRTFNVDVSADITQLKQKLKDVLPDEGIKIHAAGDSIILSGEVSSTANISTAMELAKAFVACEKKLVNLMQVGGVQQVMLEVRVAEMGRKLMRELGINWSYLSDSFNIAYLNNLTSGTNSIFNYLNSGKNWTGAIDALKTEGLVKILAKPTLITLSGENAEFLAGGEIPVPVPGDWGEVCIEWKKYGVELQFTPRVLSNNRISMSVLPAVSELDYEHSVEFWGFVIPALTKRQASTTIELDDGQSFAIAGLLNERIYENVEKFPILGEIPVLGALFRSQEFQRHETELVIIVTPHLVKPLDMAKQTLPTDAYVEPDDFEFYLLGLMEGHPKGGKRSSVLFKDEGLEGNFGHISP